MTDRLREAPFGVGGQELDQHARAIGGILLLSGGHRHISGAGQGIEHGPGQMRKRVGGQVWYWTRRN